MNVTWEYPDGRLLVYENYPFTEYGIHGFDNGNVFYGTEGYMVFSRARRLHGLSRQEGQERDPPRAKILAAIWV